MPSVWTDKAANERYLLHRRSTITGEKANTRRKRKENDKQR
jgi:hypothetical protein